MTRKTIIIIFFISVLCILLTACDTASNIIDSKVRSALSDSSRSDEAIEWLIVNGDIVVPELVNRISNSGDAKAVQAAEALIAMGDYGRRGIIQRFDTMTMEGRTRICNMLAKQGDKQAVLELLALSEHSDAFDIAVNAIVSMGDLALEYLSGQLHCRYYTEAVDAALTKFGDAATDKVITAVHSTDNKKVNRALAILSSMGESAVEKMAQDALNNSESVQDAVNIADIMLKNYPESAILSLMTMISADTDKDIAAHLLYEISGDENIGLVLSQSNLGDEETTTAVLQQYVGLCGADKVLELVLTGDENISDGAKRTFTGGQYDEDTFITLLNNLSSQDDTSSKLFLLADELITDDNMALLAQSVISTDINLYAQAITEGMEAEYMGQILSACAQNETVRSRLETMVNSFEGEYRKQMYTVFGCSSDTYLPAIALKAYAQGGENGLLAASALTQTPTLNGKYLFHDLDMMPYVGKIIEGLLSGDNVQRSNAQIILSRVSEEKSQHEFYKTIFAYYKDSAIFMILASHYTGVGALSADLSMKKDGETIVPTTISIKITGDVKNVSAANEPDFEVLLTGFASYMGLNIVEDGADIDLVFDCDITPRSKRYSGLLSNSFLGASASGTLQAYIDGTKVSSVTGTALILPPDEYPGPSGEFRYMPDEEDAPSDEVFVICFINAMYRMWGEEALFTLYNFDMLATLQAAEGLFIN